MMGCVFDIGDETVWSPSLRVGQLYARLLGTLGEFFDRPVGLQYIATDMFELDLSLFSDFVHFLMESYQATEHPIYRSEIGGVLLVSIVLLERGGASFDARNSLEQDLLNDARALSESMPT